jgi:hypothetical protein
VLAARPQSETVALATIVRPGFGHSFGFSAGVVATGEHVVVKVTAGGFAEASLAIGCVVPVSLALSTV